MSAIGPADLEIVLLRGLISLASRAVSAADDPGKCQELLGAIVSYVWADEEHRVVYECLQMAQGHSRARLREEMAAEATRMGHPEVDWDVYFQLPESDVNLSELIRRLKNNP